jgi:hypothetical protein
VTINYKTNGAITAQIGSTVNPTFIIRRTSPTTTDLVTGYVPVFNVNIALLLNLRVLISVGQVVMTGDVNLSQNDIVGLFYNSDGLTINLIIGDTGELGIIWSVHSL